MKRKHKSALFVVASLLGIGCMSILIIFELGKNVSFFYTTSELLSGNIASSAVRVGGMVVEGSIVREEDGTVLFEITDLQNKLKVRFSGILPPLFRENMGAIAKGSLQGDVFVATEILAKHDEKYIPKKYSVPQEE